MSQASTLASHPTRDPHSYPRFSEQEMAARHAAVYGMIEEAGVAGLLVYSSGLMSAELYWLTDHPGTRESYVLVQPGAEPVVLIQLYNHVPLARSLSVVPDVRWAGARTGRTVAELLEERGLTAGRVGLAGGAPFSQYVAIRQQLPDLELVDLSGKLRTLRTIKSDAEIERLRIASKLTDDSMQALASELRPGLREDELAAIIEPVYLKQGGYAGIHFMTSMPMHEPNFPVPAQHQSNRVLQVGDCLITEISGYYWGYGGQIHRTYSLGEGPTPKWQRLHDVAVEAFEVIFDTIKEGVSSREIEEAAEVIHARGLTIYDDLLHGNAQLPPIIQTRSTRRHEDAEVILRENMVLVIQPNVMTPDEKMGLQFGETVVVRKNGCETLDHFPREWIVC
jgi:Xaa-Pro aminopeptidase